MTKEDAIKRIKDWNLNNDKIEVLSVIIPELKESEGVDMKSFTDIEQSKKLSEILPLESADMVIWGSDLNFVAAKDAQKFMRGLKSREMKFLPCWSLSALLNVLPEPNLLEKDGWHLFCSDTDHFSSSSGYKNPVDACYEMIIKLHELKKL